MLVAIGFIAASAIFIGTLTYLFKIKPIIDKTKNIPSPPSWPIIGQAYHFIGKQPEEMVGKLESFMLEYGNTLKIWMGPELNIVLNEIKDVEIILSSMRFNDKASEYKALEPWLKEGLLVSRGKKWYKRRKIITPAFHFKILEQFVHVFEQQSRQLVINLDKELKADRKEGFSLYDWINLCTMDTICETAMGVSLNAQTNTDSEYVAAVKKISMVIHKRMFDIIYHLDITYMFTKLAFEERKALQVLHGFTEKIIEQRREQLLHDTQTNSVEANESADRDEVGSKRKMAFLDILLQSKIDDKPLSNLDIREEVDTFMFEGHDTTSSALTFFFYNIAKYQDCQQKCFEEILSVMGNNKSTPLTYEILHKLAYVELCIKETLRMYPSVPLLGRKVLEDCEINGKFLPANTNIGISPLLLGRNANVFSEPKLFKPERFNAIANSEKINPYSYIPFSAGPRNCIGQKFALLELKTIATNVLRHFEISLGQNCTEEPVLIAELILRTKHPLMFRLKERAY